MNSYLRARQKAGISSQQASEALGIDRQRLSAYEQNALIPDAALVMHMARLYNVSADELIGSDMYSKVRAGVSS